MVSTALIRALTQLSVDGSEDAESLTDLLSALEQAVHATVSSYLGMQLTLVDHGHTITMSRFPSGVEPPDIKTSLQLPLAAVVGVDPASTIVLYAGAPGALVDLATDLAYALGPPPNSLTGEAPPPRGVSDEWFPPVIAGLVLDSGLPPVTLVSGVRGLAERIAINRAIGVLLEDGILLEQTHDELRAQASAANVALPVFAASLVSRGRGELPADREPPDRSLGDRRSS